MAKVIVYRSEGPNRIAVEKTFYSDNVTIESLLSGLGIKDAGVFLNNKVIDNFIHLLEENDVLFVFKKNN